MIQQVLDCVGFKDGGHCGKHRISKLCIYDNSGRAMQLVGVVDINSTAIDKMNVIKKIVKRAGDTKYLGGRDPGSAYLWGVGLLALLTVVTSAVPR
jgi:hypothetical protein